MNLIKSPWIPIQRKNGEQDLIAPWQIAEKDIIGISSPRVDFDGALIQFLIGLLQTTMTPSDESEWGQYLENPPESELLKGVFSKYAHAFEVTGDNPRFMQDFGSLEVKSPNAISDLLIDAPGGNTIKENKDHFVKRGTVEQLCPICAITALLTLQTNAPSGGQGHRTSLRGGGPLTTLIVNDPNNSGLTDNLWTNLWLNVLDKTREKEITGDWSNTEDSAIFPWLAKTKTSEKTTGTEVFPEDTHPDQMYWSMPRRIRILWDKTETGHCDICNANSNKLVTHYETKNYGVNYSGQWQHPLSPHSINKDNEILPRHAQPDGMTYRHWLGLVTNLDSLMPAKVVARYQEVIARFTEKEGSEQLRIRAFGYDMDNMKARCWYETTFPLYELVDKDGVDLSHSIKTLTTTATDVASMVRSCIKEAWFRRPGDARGDTSFLQHAFFQHTEKSFYQCIERLIKNESEKEVFNAWHKVLRQSAYALFDYWSDNGDFAQSDPKRIAKAHTKLRKLLHGKKLLGELQVAKPKKELA